MMFYVFILCTDHPRYQEVQKFMAALVLITFSLLWKPMLKVGMKD